MTDLNTFTPDWVSAPGETIEDLLEEKGWTQKELAQRTGLSEKHISQLINGKAHISEDVALRLEKALGSTAGFWLRRDAQYREALARQQEAEDLKQHKEWLKQIKASWLIKQGLIKKFRHAGMQVAECLRFFGVSSLDAWNKQYGQQAAAFKKTDKFENHDGATAAWLRAGELQAEKIKTKPYDKAKFIRTLEKVRKLTQKSDPDEFIPQLIALCAEAGVAVVFHPAPDGCRASGATRWLSRSKAMIMLSLRHRTNDHLWFTFFHEAAHIVLHDKMMLFIESGDKLKDKHEDEADAFARDMLIPPEEADRLSAIPGKESSITEFAENIGVAPAIVLGRMQHDGLIPWKSTLNTKLKIRYQWAEGK